MSKEGKKKIKRGGLKVLSTKRQILEVSRERRLEEKLKVHICEPN